MPAILLSFQSFPLCYQYNPAEAATVQTLLYSKTTNLFRNISSAYSLLLKTRFPALLLSVLIQSQMLSSAMDF